MDARIEALLSEMEQRWQREQEEQASLPRAEAYARIDSYLLPVGPETGRLMSDLIKAGGCRTIVEVGSSYGYSTIWLADAARQSGGRVTSLELHAGKIASARASLASVGLADHVDFIEGDALAGIEAMAGPIDFVLIDLWKDLYIPCLERLVGKLAPGAMIVADNMIFPPDNADNAVAYRKRVKELGLDTVLLPIGAGIELSRMPG